MTIAAKVTEVWSGLYFVLCTLYFDKQVNTDLSHFCMQVCRDSLLDDYIT